MTGCNFHFFNLCNNYCINANALFNLDFKQLHLNMAVLHDFFNTG